jgi:hypothetical protein
MKPHVKDYLRKHWRARQALYEAEGFTVEVRA